MTDGFDLQLSPAELDQLRAGYRLRLAPSLTPPEPRHYSHIRIAQLAYHGNPLGPVEQKLLAESVDLVIAGEASMVAQIRQYAPQTPVALYTNLSNIYGDLLTDWTAYAAARKIDPETAFLHEKTTGARLCYAGDPKRPLTNPACDAFAAWACAYHQRLLGGITADGFFVDNSLGVPPALSPAATVAEDISGYTAAYAMLLGSLTRLETWLDRGSALIIPNTAGATLDGALAMAQAAGWYYAEFQLRPLSDTWKRFLDIAAFLGCVNESLPEVRAILDVLPRGGFPADPRTQIATLTYYYLLADPERTYLDFFGGFGPATPWVDHWSPAAAVDIGRPRGLWTVTQSGRDPADPQASYRIYSRRYEKAQVIYRPLSAGGLKPVEMGDASAVFVPAKGRPLQSDGTLGAAVTSLSLRNGEGVILVQ